MDIDDWLRGIGLAQYAEIFRANDIDGELLGRLTNDDLKDIGVASFGHRKKLLEAIAALVAAPEAPSPIPVAATEPKTQDTAERRQVTVMFSDLAGSTAGPGGSARGHFRLSEMRRRNLAPTARSDFRNHLGGPEWRPLDVLRISASKQFRIVIAFMSPRPGNVRASVSD